MTDDQLIDRFLDGNIQAFNLLVGRWHKPIYNFTLRYLGNPEDAKDITQKTFIKVYKNIKKLKDRKKFSAWLYQIALNLCRDETKRRHRLLSIQTLEKNNHRGAMDAMPSLSEKAPNPEKQLQRSELKNILQQALNHIPEEQKIVVIMKELQGFKFTEIAEILDTPVNTVKSRMYYGLNALRKVLNQWKINKEAIHYEL
ncbi:MAG: sigma-70 family RNA polymerase sigma factor [Calditrichaeota bacterium]|nr:MAG: sigma-70 family RNA polymerase sigma factor [Calditrichota bacterium]